MGRNYGKCKLKIGKIDKSRNITKLANNKHARRHTIHSTGSQAGRHVILSS